MPFQNTIITNTTPATIVTPTAGFFNDVIWLIITNTSATGTRVDISAAGGTACSFWLQPTSTVQIFPPAAIPNGSLNNGWTATLGTAVTDIRVFVSYLTHT